MPNRDGPKATLTSERRHAILGDWPQTYLPTRMSHAVGHWLDLPLAPSSSGHPNGPSAALRSLVGEEVHGDDTHSDDREPGCGNRGNMSHRHLLWSRKETQR